MCFEVILREKQYSTGLDSDLKGSNIVSNQGHVKAYISSKCGDEGNGAKR